MFLYIKNIIVSAGSLTLSATGGVGGYWQGGAGGGGGGGTIVLCTQNSNPITNCSLNVNGGLGGFQWIDGSGSTDGSGALGNLIVFYNLS